MVIVPIDKAANNLAFICKRHYAHVIFSELKYANNVVDINSETYKCIEVSSTEVITTHKTALAQYDLPLKEDMDCLPSMYWIPKMHKTPIGERFIIAPPKCSIKPLLKDTTSILKLFQNQVQTFHDKIGLGKG